MYKYELTVNGEVYKHTNHKSMQLDTKFPCVVQLKRNDFTKSIYPSNYFNKPIIVLGYKSNQLPHRHLNGSCIFPYQGLEYDLFEVIGYPIMDSKTGWPVEYTEIKPPLPYFWLGFFSSSIGILIYNVLKSII